MPKRNAAGVLLSDDSMWWWDGSRWHPATAATSGRPPRAPGSPWPWILLAVAALLLVTALPIWVVWMRTGGPPGLRGGYDRGFAGTYVPQRQSALAGLRADLGRLAGCESQGSGPCFPEADDLSSAADAETGAIRTESGLFFFPGCLRASASAELTALERVHDAAQSIRMLTSAEAGSVHSELRVMDEGLAAAASAVVAARC